MSRLDFYVMRQVLLSVLQMMKRKLTEVTWLAQQVEEPGAEAASEDGMGPRGQPQSAPRRARGRRATRPWEELRWGPPPSNECTNTRGGGDESSTFQRHQNSFLPVRRKGRFFITDWAKDTRSWGAVSHLLLLHSSLPLFHASPLFDYDMYWMCRHGAKDVYLQSPSMLEPGLSKYLLNSYVISIMEKKRLKLTQLRESTRVCVCVQNSNM